MELKTKIRKYFLNKKNKLFFASINGKYVLMTEDRIIKTKKERDKFASKESSSGVPTLPGWGLLKNSSDRLKRIKGYPYLISIPGRVSLLMTKTKIIKKFRSDEEFRAWRFYR